ncbi:hypothetical protein B0H19DRAFT_1268930 [Mycena capillaripes]|nr:hypothetical protein B0H19DRAFT_1268930 [Mycena capillaripes]
MHHCLKITEIVDMICFHLHPKSSSPPWPAKPFRDLAAMAKTCQIFLNPALDYLWSSATLVQLVIRCMPADLWAVDPRTTTSYRHQVRLLRTIRASDWDRLHLYAPRVKELTSGLDGHNLSSVLPTLSALPDSLFRNLRTLDWRHQDPDFHHIHHFLRPTLTKIRLSPTTVSGWSILSTLLSKCPKLIDVSIASHSYEDPSVVSDFVRGLQFATTIYVPSVDQDVLEHLSSIPTLKSLTFQTLPENLTLSPVGERRTFPVLRELILEYPDIMSTTQFLAWCSAVALQTFNVTFYAVTAAELHSLFATISTSLSPSHFMELTVDSQCEEPDTTNPDAFLVANHSLRLLFRFTNLTVLSLTSPLGFDLDDDAISELAQAWPKIVTLRLKGRHPTHQPPRTTIACLNSFARHCPSLTLLTIVFDATIIPTAEADPRTRPVQHRLKTLDVQNSPLQTSIAAARFLSRVFPNLDDIDTHCEFEDSDDEDELLQHGDVIRLHKRWKEVLALLPEVSAIREEGRMLALEQSSA